MPGLGGMYATIRFDLEDFMKYITPFEKRLLLVLVPCSVWAFISMIALRTMDKHSFAFFWFDLTMIVVCFGCLAWTHRQLKKLPKK